MKHQESKLQQACVRWFRYQHPKLVKNLFACPNGSRRDAVTGAILKAEGVVAGVADLLLLVPNSKYHGLCIEMKWDRGRQSPEQMAWEDAVTAQGYRYAVIRTIEDFVAEVNGYLSDR